jgi:hypothetical protein
MGNEGPQRFGAVEMGNGGGSRVVLPEGIDVNVLRRIRGTRRCGKIWNSVASRDEAQALYNRHLRVLDIIPAGCSQPPAGEKNSSPHAATLKAHMSPRSHGLGTTRNLDGRLLLPLSSRITTQTSGRSGRSVEPGKNAHLSTGTDM